MEKVQKTKGFTIIEVVLVLAIAGLIFLMVFIALPALQRSQRDTAKKNEVSKVLAAVTNFQSNNKGTNPSLADAAKSAAFAEYVDGTGVADKVTMSSGTTISMYPSGTIAANDTAVTGITTDNITVYLGAKCDDAGVAGVLDKGTVRQSAALIKLESGNATYCQTN